MARTQSRAGAKRRRDGDDRRPAATAEANAPASAGTETPPRLGRGAAVAVLGVALTIRLIHWWLLRRSPYATALLGDALAYDSWARTLASGDWLGHEVFYQAPLYPYLLGAVYRLFGHSLDLVRLFQALAGAITCLLLAHASARLFGPRAGLLSGLLFAGFAPAVFFDGLIQKSSLDAFLLAALLALLTLPAGRWPRIAPAGAGAVLGGLVLSRENALVLLPLLVVWLYLRHRPALGPAALCLFGALTVLAPVALRNLAVGGELHLTTSQLGPNLYIGNHAQASGTYEPLRRGRGSAAYERTDATELAEEAEGRPLAPAEVSRYWQRRAVDWVVGRPGDWLALFARKLMLVWNADEATDTEDLASHAEVSWVLAATRPLHFGVLASLGLVGVWISRRRWREIWILHAIGIVYTLSVATFYVLARYRYPLAPLLAIFGGAALAGVMAWWRASGAAERAGVVAGCGLAVVAIHQPLLSPAAMQAVTRENMAYAFQVEGRLEEAERWYRGALELNPNSATAHNSLGALLTTRGEHAAALDHLHTAVRLDPELAEARVNLGIELAARGDSDSAIVEFRAAVASDPRLAAAHYNLGTALAQAGQLAAAIPAMQTAVRLEPGNAAAHANLGTMLAQSGQLAAGIVELRAALALAPGSAEAAANLAYAEQLAARTPAGRTLRP